MRKTRSSDGMAVLLLAFCLGEPACSAQQSGWRGALLRMTGGGTGDVVSMEAIAGEWRGGKTQNDPVHGGFLNLEFRFIFAKDGTYQETASMSGQQVMVANGTYTIGGARKQGDQSVTNRLSFTPTECHFASDGVAEAVKLFPIPKERALAVYLGLGGAESGGHMTLEDMSQGSDRWSLKPVH